MIELNGKIIRDEIKAQLAADFSSLPYLPDLAIITVGDDPASISYVGQKEKFGAALGLSVRVVKLPSDVSQQEILEKIDLLNSDKSVGGIIVQLPIPESLNKRIILDRIDWRKDVDGLGSVQSAKLYHNDPSAVVPATARGVITMLDYYKLNLSGKKVVIIGRSELVGKPLAMRCLNLDATVTICHSKTEDLQNLAKAADILIVAAGKPGMVDKNFVNRNQIIVDIGMHKMAEGFCGDVARDGVWGEVKAMTPVPGGVGPLTVLSLFQNLLQCAGYN